MQTALLSTEYCQHLARRAVSSVNMNTYETADNKYVTVNGVAYAYRQFGVPNSIPLVMCNHFRSTIDQWDPKLVNALCASRTVVLVDYPGTGRSNGQAPTSFADTAHSIISTIQAIGLREVDVLGLSIGGCIAQLVALNSPPGLVRRLILCGTRGSGAAPGTAPADYSNVKILADAITLDQQREAYLRTFYPLHPRGRARGLQVWERMAAGRSDRMDYLGREGTANQLQCMKYWGKPRNEREESWSRLQNLTIPVLVANGSNDVLVPTVNSWMLYKQLPNAQLHLFPDSGHGFLNEWAEMFARLVCAFLESEEGAYGGEVKAVSHL
ncbi:hypothetical protein LTS18_006891 [Coniosporium uncinatum]|uniref:Uncharacterized protein n=1 Tax=Coniosporium uncinatum TaxID=93489 RepID=A0ACC3DAN7_9PEZI|nr:hypothetical protein LTS18_006891 [Coniosporium uncinatum]